MTPDLAMAMLTAPGRLGSVFERSAQEDRGHSSPCWIFKGRLDRDGYALVGRFGMEKQRVHRLAYVAFVGAIPDGLVIDHLCRQPDCFNPLHLEVVTPDENSKRMAACNPHLSDLLRGMRAPRRKLPPSERRPGLRSHCKRGHELTPENTYMQGGGRWQQCLTCTNEGQRRRRAEAKHKNHQGAP